MNYLAHLHLGGPEPEAILGSLYGDFVKGRLKGQWPSGIEAAISLHRKIDAFTDQHPLLDAAKSRFRHTPRRYTGIILDVFFDHCLAKHWSQYHNEPLPVFTHKVYQVLTTTSDLPGKLAFIAPKMAEHDWLGSYQRFPVLEQVLTGINRRLREPLALARGFDELSMQYKALEQDFLTFYPALLAYAQTLRQMDKG